MPAMALRRREEMRPRTNRSVASEKFLDDFGEFYDTSHRQFHGETTEFGFTEFCVTPENREAKLARLLVRHDEPRQG